MKMQSFVLGLLVSFSQWSLLTAQDEAPATSEVIVSGPKVGTAITPIHCVGSGREFDVAEKLGTAPGAILFIHELTRNTAPVINGLDQLASDHSIHGFRTYTIMLGADRTAGEDQTKRVNGSLKLRNPIVLGLDGSEGPGNYALNRNAALTLIFCKDGKVLRSEALTDTGPNDVPKIRQWVEEIAGPLPKGRRALLAALPTDGPALREFAVDRALEVQRLEGKLKRLQENNRNRSGRAMNRRPERPKANADKSADETKATEKPKRQGKPPEDSKLNALLRSFIRKTNDEAKADEVYARITKRAGESDALKGEAIEMFKLMLSFRDRYGIEHAQKLAEGFLKEHAK